ncbi:MAG: phosphatidylserine decarboxylase [Oligoflexia bacterium]|nr:phosphatidylserine decarboxylase [Oligoflexia bacterium]
MKIQIWNRKLQRLEDEQVYGDLFLKLAYSNSISTTLTDRFLSRKWISEAYGKIQNTKVSAKKVPTFIEKFKINMDEFEDGPFRSFNDFFIRKFKDKKRIFPKTLTEMGAFAEARYFGCEEVKGESFSIKNIRIDPLTLLGNNKFASRFLGGPCLIARLCPTDYHRFHFPDSGKFSDFYTCKGKLHSVNPYALEKKSEIFLENERTISLLDTDNFGLLAYIEVGALCVGKIVQSAPIQNSFKRGQEKGYFLFGGSTVVLLGEPKSWQPSSDILENTKRGIETFVELGSSVANKKN